MLSELLGLTTAGIKVETLWFPQGVGCQFCQVRHLCNEAIGIAENMHNHLFTPPVRHIRNNVMEMLSHCYKRRSPPFQSELSEHNSLFRKHQTI